LTIILSKKSFRNKKAHMVIYSTAKTFKKHRPFEPAITLKDRCKSVFLSMENILTKSVIIPNVNTGGL